MNNKQILILLIVLGLGLWLSIGFLFRWNDNVVVDAEARYVGGASCIECHREQYGLFQGSHHDRAMDRATEDTVLADFDGSKIEHYGITSTVFRSGERFMVNTEGPDGQMHDYEVKMVFGVEPLQQYMVELEPSKSPDCLGRYQVLRLSWDVQKKAWFYLAPPDVDEKIEPNDPLHWTGISQRWNSNCATCHSTNLQKNFNAITRSYATKFTDINVNCESCHGPGSVHVQRAHNGEFGWGKHEEFGLAKLKSTSNLPQVEACAPCHSRRSELRSGHQAGQRFGDFYSCQLLSRQIYHDDGQIRDEDYVYGSFVQSRMFHQGIRCSDCHDPHSTRVKFNDNRLCTSCHQHPAGKYDTPAHHRHQMGSTGAKCVECHMPSTTYMAIDPRRDHSLRVPRPDLSAMYGTPNACTACHFDVERLPEGERDRPQYLDYLTAAETGNTAVADELKRVNEAMATAFKQWYPNHTSNEKRSKYYEQLVLGKASLPESQRVLQRLAVDRSAPAIFRASALETLLDDETEASLQTANQALDDSDPMVVAAAIALLNVHFGKSLDAAQYEISLNRTFKDFEPYLRRIVKLLENDTLRVRIEAARTLANLPAAIRGQINGLASSNAFQRAVAEYKESIRLHSDLAASHMVLASLHESAEQWSKAEDAYRTAISVEPTFTGPRSNLAGLLDERVAQLRNQMLRGPRSGQSAALAERMDRLASESARLRTEENGLLKTEVRRIEGLSGADELYYRYGLSCYLLGNLKESEKYLQKAFEIRPDHEVYILGVAAFFQQQRRFQEAIPMINRLIDIAPDNQGYRNMRDQVLAELRKQ